ncbi:hypothetical protein [Martelella sp. HB161492]|uniref:hypothetical protein n=1 Tax=Martelella sp. HB161492 TaxID=2720726 RepID=UPI001590294B|nr:hypothetical protein [Martelella sp. HB161492]
MATISSPEKGGARLSLGASLVVLAAAVALLLTGWRYFAPLSGITGTSGALLAMFGAFMLILAGLAFFVLEPGRWRTLFLVLSWLGAILTLIAELFLHGWGSSVALAVCLCAIAIETFAAPSRRSAS